MRRSLTRLFVEYVPKMAVPAASSSAASPHLATRNFRITEDAAALADKEIEERGFFFAPRMDYDVTTGVAPLLSKTQFDIQQVFHRDAIERLNTLTLGTELEGHPLEVVIRKSSFDATQAAVHAAASEHFNYCFWYRSLRPWGTSVPPLLREELQLQYGHSGTVDAMQEVQRLVLLAALNEQMGCGWVYLVWTGKSFDVLSFPHGTCPIGNGLVPLLALNIHESAYAYDYAPLAQQTDGSGLEQYVRNYFKTNNWTLADRYFAAALAKN